MKTISVENMLANLWTEDIINLICRGKHKEAISVGVKMGISKKYLKKIIKEIKETKK